MLGDMGWTIREQTLQIPHFGVGNGLSSDVVVTNLSSTETASVAIDIWSPEGSELDGNRILGVGAGRFDLPPLGSRTLTLSNDEGGVLSGSMTVSSATPVSAVVHFDLQGTGITGVGTSPRLREAMVLLQGSVVEGGGLPTKGRLRSSVQLHQRASVRYVACLIHV